MSLAGVLEPVAIHAVVAARAKHFLAGMMSSSPRRVVITGLGTISPFGNTAEALWDALAAGRNGYRGPTQKERRNPARVTQRTLRS